MSETGRKWTVATPFHGVPKLSDFRLVEEQVSKSLKPGAILVEALFWTVDPYMRARVTEATESGTQMPGEQVCRVKVSNNESYPEGTLLLAFLGWRTLTVLDDPENLPGLGGMGVRRLPKDLGDVSPSLALGCLGMPGVTAYYGILDRGRIKSGETVLVSGAAGAVGSVVGQIAKIKGCTVIGSAGTKAKCDWLKELGFDHVFNYKETTVDDALKQFAPGGIDCYFDNVGGDFSWHVLKDHIKFCGRVVVCGAISQYNDTEHKEKSTFGSIIYKQLDVLGLIVVAYKDRFPEAITQLAQWLKEGKLKYRETVTEGFDKMPQAFIDLFKGGNTGKAIIKATTK